MSSPDVDFSTSAIARQDRWGTAVALPVRMVFRLAGSIVESGLENLPASGPVIIAAYHANYLDPVLVGLSMKKHGRMPHYLAKDSLFTGPLGPVLTTIGQIPVLRNSAHAGDSLSFAHAALDSGAAVVIYPQGTLTKDPDLWPQHAKSGTARLAIEAQVPVVPVAHWGLEDVLPRGTKVPKLSAARRLLVDYAPPIDPGDFAATPAGISALSRRITAEIAAGVARLRGVELPERFAVERRLRTTASAPQEASASEDAAKSSSHEGSAHEGSTLEGSTQEGETR